MAVEDETAAYLLDDIWAELEHVSVPVKLKVTQLTREYGEACADAALREWKRGIT